MRRLLTLLIAVVLLSSHDMYLKLDSYFLEADSPATIKLFNGTIENSENSIDRNRMSDVSLVGNGERIHPDTTQWSERENMTLLSFKTGAAATWVAGVSTKSRDFAMDAGAFNDYLEHGGILDVLNWRKENNALDQNAVERYSKHVKTIFQVGDKKTNDWQTELGYPIEFIPLVNPYDLHAGDIFRVKLLWQGEPLGHQLVSVDSRNAHDHAEDHTHTHAEGDGHDHSSAEGEDHQHTANLVRTNAKGELILTMANEGVWYLHTIHLVESEEPGLTHESNWATLTFEIGHRHGEGTHTHGNGEEHSHAHDEEAGVPSYFFWGGSLVVLVGLFFFFNRKS